MKIQVTQIYIYTFPGLMFVYHISKGADPESSISAHVPPDPHVVEESFDGANGADSDILVPQFLSGKFHHVLFRDLADDALNFFWMHASARCDDLPANVLGYGRSPVQREQDRRFQLRLGTFGFRRGHVV